MCNLSKIQIEVISSHLLIKTTQCKQKTHKFQQFCFGFSFCTVLTSLKKYIYILLDWEEMSFIEERKRKQITFTHQETLPAENDAACPHLGNWLCMYLNMNKWKNWLQSKLSGNHAAKIHFTTNIIIYTIIKGKLCKVCSNHKSWFMTI